MQGGGAPGGSLECDIREGTVIFWRDSVTTCAKQPDLVPTFNLYVANPCTFSLYLLRCVVVSYLLFQLDERKRITG